MFTTEEYDSQGNRTALLFTATATTGAEKTNTCTEGDARVRTAEAETTAMSSAISGHLKSQLFSDMPPSGNYELNFTLDSAERNVAKSFTFKDYFPLFFKLSPLIFGQLFNPLC